MDRRAIQQKADERYFNFIDKINTHIDDVAADNIILSDTSSKKSKDALNTFNTDILLLTQEFLVNEISGYKIKIRTLEEKAEGTFSRVQLLSTVLFSVGVLLAVAGAVVLGVAVFNDNNIVGGLTISISGIITILGFLFYKPIQTIQQANSDISQQMILLNSWILHIKLLILGIEVDDKAQVRQSAQDLRDSMLVFAKAFEDFVEPKPADTWWINNRQSTSVYNAQWSEIFQ